MAEKDEKDTTHDTCNQTSSCNQGEKKTPRSEFPHDKHRLGSHMIPDWIERWALGD